MNYIYLVENSSAERGFNRTVTGYKMVRNKPEYVGKDDRQNSAAWVGAYGVACKIISAKHGHKMADGYSLKNKNIKSRSKSEL